jgi:glycosyltransferase involved in cell wall biosynthesis
VRSVLDQPGADVRVLIIDDASPDDTAEVAAALAGEDSRVAVVRHAENRGHIDTYNEGIEWATSEYMLLLSADDYLLPGALSRVGELVASCPDVGLVYGNVIELADSGRQTQAAGVSTATCVLGSEEFIRLSGAENLVATCSAVVPTHLQKRLGGYRRELPHAGDMEMWLRFAVHARVGFIAENQGVYRQHRANMSAAHYLIDGGSVEFRKNGRLTDLQQRKLALDCFAEYCCEVVPEREYLCRWLYRRLSRLAIGRASEAFNEAETEEVSALLAFALAACPEVKGSPEWSKLACKRLIGLGAWQALKPCADAIRAIRPSNRLRLRRA